MFPFNTWGFLLSGVVFIIINRYIYYIYIYLYFGPNNIIVTYRTKIYGIKMGNDEACI